MFSTPTHLAVFVPSNKDGSLDGTTSPTMKIVRTAKLTEQIRSGLEKNATNHKIGAHEPRSSLPL